MDQLTLWALKLSVTSFFGLDCSQLKLIDIEGIADLSIFILNHWPLKTENSSFKKKISKMAQVVWFGPDPFMFFEDWGILSQMHKEDTLSMLASIFCSQGSLSLPFSTYLIVRWENPQMCWKEVLEKG